MAEHRLTAVAALGRTPLAETIGPLRIEERVDLALASIAARLGCEVELVARAEVAGISLPGPLRAVAGEVWGAIWTGPGQWLLEAPFGTHEEVAAHLTPIFGDTASITEQTDAWVRLDVTGPLAPFLERLCNIDLARFPPGSATRTLMEHLGVLVIRRAEDRVTLLAARSSAGSLHHALTTAARSVF